MKQVITTLFLMFLLTGTKAQTLKETQSWILSKLSKYKREYSYSSNSCSVILVYYNYSFKFKNDTLVVSHDNTVLVPDCYSGGKVDKTKISNNYPTKTISEIPTSEIIKIASSNRKELEVKTETNQVINTYIYESGNPPYIKHTGHLVYIGLDLEAENSLLKDLQKAFTHLKTFYPKIQQEETF